MVCLGYGADPVLCHPAQGTYLNERSKTRVVSGGLALIAFGTQRIPGAPLNWIVRVGSRPSEPLEP